MVKQDWTSEFLLKMRQVADPLADDTIAQVFEHGEVEVVNRLLRLLVANEGVPPEGMPPEVDAYLQASSELPSWADPEKIRRGEEVFALHGPMVVLCLVCASLPECYTLHRGAKILVLTNKLVADPDRRLHETAMMAFPVMSPGGLAPNGIGIRQAQKVRLMHAAIRHLILQAEQTAATEAPSDIVDALVRLEWNIERDGQPINQEDMALTLLSFSYVILRGLETLGVSLSAEDKDAYLHCWNVVGHILGVKPELLAHEDSAAEVLFGAIKAGEAGESAEGHTLTAALVGLAENLMPYRWLRPFPSLLVQILVGRATAKMLGVGQGYGAVTRCLARTALWAVRTSEGTLRILFKEFSLSRRIGEWMARRLVRYLLSVTRDGARPKLQIPESLSEAWGIGTY